MSQIIRPPSKKRQESIENFRDERLIISGSADGPRFNHLDIVRINDNVKPWPPIWKVAIVTNIAREEDGQYVSLKDSYKNLGLLVESYRRIKPTIPYITDDRIYDESAIEDRYMCETYYIGRVNLGILIEEDNEFIPTYVYGLQTDWEPNQRLTGLPVPEKYLIKVN